MNSIESISSDRIFGQLEKLFANSRFAESELLRKFLNFIVHETLAGRAEHLKEYTIATCVLNKPINFDPRMDGIVRVHARRLRDALINYYENTGIHDTCRIHIPKGRYVPIFQMAHHLPKNAKANVIPMAVSPKHPKKTNLILVPFKTFNPDNLKSIFVDHVRLALTAKMATASELNVKYYHGIIENFKSIRNSVFASDYTVSGEADFTSGQFRIIFHLVETFTKKKIWSEEFNFSYNLAENYKKTSVILSRILSCIQNNRAEFGQSTLKMSIVG